MQEKITIKLWQLLRSLVGAAIWGVGCGIAFVKLVMK